MAIPVTANVFDSFLSILAQGGVNLATEPAYGFLSGSVPNTTTQSDIGDVVDISAAGGYDPATGLALPTPSVSVVSNQIQVEFTTNLVFIPSAAIDEFQYLYIGFPNLSGDPLWAVISFPDPINLDSGVPLVVDLSILNILRRAV
jgi:hypothetical protein